ncbi:MAG: ATP-binding protein [Candidatus Daviesbacteria bacterium]|nr:ATP-binding protein [Candidatus Daviesbacteria bacterium]
MMTTDPKKNTVDFSLADAIAPLEIEVDFAHLRLNQTLYRTFFVSGYPRFVAPNWLEPLISFEHSLNVSMFIYPTKSAGVLGELKRKIAEMEATIQTDSDRGREIDPAVLASLEDAQELQAQMVRGAERFFQFSLYVTVPAQNKEELNNISKLVESTLGSISITTHPVTLQMTEGFSSTVPLGENPLYLTHNMDTTSLATTFPFTTSELTSPEGVVYGINEHNDSLIIYDRFAGENANSVILATSGSGKSYFIKLEALRSLMLGTDVIIIDPEKEYAHLAEAVGGDYINFSTSSPVKINPFDLPSPTTESQGEDELGRKILSLMGFLKLVLGDLNANETAMLDRAINTTYRLKGITKSADYQQGMQLPLMEDLYKVLIGMEDAMSQSLALRLERFIKGSLAGIFSAQSNVQINNQLTVFSVRDLPESLRPLAMYLILDYIWTKIRFELKKRILIVDEAWYMMKYPDSAAFLVELVKRARKYYLGVTTISQDVEDFWGENKGKEIISNSAMQVLFKQAPVSIERIGDTFNLSQGERRLLLSAGVGRGIFFAGNVHVAMRVVASEEEHKLITTKPEEIIKAT